MPKRSLPPKPVDRTSGERDAAERRSGRVGFDDRGQAVWEWAVRTGMFDRRASTQRVRALTEESVQLELEDTRRARELALADEPPSGNPYDQGAATAKGGGTAGGDPFRRAQAASRPAPGVRPESKGAPRRR